MAAGLALLATTTPARAGLGGAYASIEADRAHLSAHMKASAVGVYTVQTLTLPNQGVVKEFTRNDGTVFAIAWRGPGRPDLRQLLGPRFETLQADNVRTQGPRMRRPMSVNRADLVVNSAGHSGAFWGLAYMPQLAPAGFSVSDLK